MKLIWILLVAWFQAWGVNHKIKTCKLPRTNYKKEAPTNKIMGGITRENPEGFQP